MNIQENISLKPFNTFGIDQNARFFLEAKHLIEFQEGLAFAKTAGVPFVVLGGGSNILLTKDMDGLVILNRLMGIEVIKEDEDHVWVEAGAGENWHQFVMHCLKQNWGGLENLSLIPGTVGASPMQNIGAYGVEIKDTFVSLMAFHKERQELQCFDAEACQFGYRESVFKNTCKDQYIILSVQFKLSKHNHTLYTAYGAIQATLESMGVHDPSIQDVSNAVIHIRSTKLPDPAKIGNAGSFFKNPTIPEHEFQQLKLRFADIPSFPTDLGVKIPAAWLIEQCGWKGKVIGKIGVHKDQPLVLVNYGGGSGQAIVALSQDIQASVLDRFGIALQAEVNFL